MSKWMWCLDVETCNVKYLGLVLLGTCRKFVKMKNFKKDKCTSRPE